MRIGITGHQRLENPGDWSWVEHELSNILGRIPPPLIGLSSLAIGADQMFARAILHHGGSLEVIVPFDGYKRTFTDEANRREYERLLRAASRVETLQRAGTDEEAYLAAGWLLVDKADLLVAVWNGKPAAGPGGTADIVQYARERGKALLHLNPATHSIVEYPIQK